MCQSVDKLYEFIVLEYIMISSKINIVLNAIWHAKTFARVSNSRLDNKSQL